tara:strand:- start:238 stop:414 length:177 start_codon:yes stop_codon:yes gene_type:complete
MVLSSDLFIIKNISSNNIPPPPEKPNEKVYKCRICKKRFICLDYFARHLKIEHQIIIA